MSGLLGFAQGLQTAHSMKLQNQQAKLQAKQDARSQQRFDLQQRMAQFNFDSAMESKEKQKRVADLTALDYRMRSMRKRHEAGERIDPSELQQFKQFQVKTLNSALPEFINQGAGAGERKRIKEFVPIDNDHFGAVLDVESPGGKREVAWTERRSSDPNDNPAIVSRDDFLEMLNQARQALDESLISEGSTLPMDRMNAQAEQQAKRQQIDYEHSLSLAEIAARGDQSRQTASQAHQGRLAEIAATGSQQRQTQAARPAQGADGKVGGYTAKDVHSNVRSTVSKFFQLDNGQLGKLFNNDQAKISAIQTEIEKRSMQDFESGQAPRISEHASTVMSEFMSPKEVAELQARSPNVYAALFGGQQQTGGLAAAARPTQQVAEQAQAETQEQGPGLLGAIQGRQGNPAWQRMNPRSQQIALSRVRENPNFLEAFERKYGFKP